MKKTFLIAALFFSVFISCRNSGKPAPETWQLHIVHNGFIIANSLSPGDVNQDGFTDYAVIDESLGLYTVVFNPGKQGDVHQEWARTIVSASSNPEYAALADLDADGNLDMVGVDGDDLEKGILTGVKIFWGPSPDKASDSTAWINGGSVPGTNGKQFTYCQSADLNGDGAFDIIVGGRRHSVSKEYTGLFWIEAPQTKENRRDLSKWQIHYIDEKAFSGHAFVFEDVDNDGDMDVVDANADFDTPDSEEQILWYENPGTDSDLLKQNWKSHQIFRSTDFYPKPQVSFADFNGDNLRDLCSQTQNFIYLLPRKMDSIPSWDVIKIKKGDTIQWIGRPVKFADFNNDGKIDIAGMLIHNDGNLPKAKASVFWLEQITGGSDGWKLHVIKWSDGTNSYHQWIGEKWDHLLPVDIDADGDLDIIANCEENYVITEGVNKPLFSVVWFENPVIGH
jgi:hypothetical protein